MPANEHFSVNIACRSKESGRIITIKSIEEIIDFFSPSIKQPSDLTHVQTHNTLSFLVSTLNHTNQQLTIINEKLDDISTDSFRDLHALVIDFENKHDQFVADKSDKVFSTENILSSGLATCSRLISYLNKFSKAYLTTDSHRSFSDLSESSFFGCVLMLFQTLDQLNKLMILEHTTTFQSYKKYCEGILDEVNHLLIHLYNGREGSSSHPNICTLWDEILKNDPEYFDYIDLEQLRKLDPRNNNNPEGQFIKDVWVAGYKNKHHTYSVNYPQLKKLLSTSPLAIRIKSIQILFSIITLVERHIKTFDDLQNCDMASQQKFLKKQILSID